MHMPWFFERRETTDEIMFMFNHPYFLIIALLVPAIIQLFILFTIPWLILIPNFLFLFVMCIFLMDNWKVLKEIRIAKNQGRSVKFSGKLFSYFDPWTYTIQKK